MLRRMMFSGLKNVTVTPPTYTVENTVRLNFLNEYGNTAIPNWNNWNAVESTITVDNGATFTPLLTDTGINTGESVKVTKAFSGNTSSSISYVGTNPIYPVDAINSAFKYDEIGAQLTFNGLNPAKFYQFYILAATSSSNASAQFTMGGVMKTKIITNNLPADGGNEYTDPSLVIFLNQVPNSSGLLTLDMAVVPGSFYEACINTVVFQQSNSQHA